MAEPKPQADQAAATIVGLEVVNNNDFTINDMFDGIPVKFPPGEPVETSESICHHLFGWPGELPDRALHMAKRFGWSGKDYLKPEGPGDDTPRYFKLAEKIIITPVYYDLVKRKPSDPIPVDLGDEASDRPVATMPEDTTKVGKRKRVGRRVPPSRRDRHQVDSGRGVRLGSR